MIESLANTKPPESIKVNGSSYPVNYHYLVWIEILDLLDDVDLENLFTGENKESLKEDLETILQIEDLAFGMRIPENIVDIVLAVTGFAAGYPQPHGRTTSPPSPRRLFDFELDLNSIIIAIRNQSGIDLSEDEGLFHWWRFLVEFSNLSGDHHICKLMELRAYNGDDKEMKKARDAVALPPKTSRNHQRFNDEMDKLFYNC